MIGKTIEVQDGASSFMVPVSQISYIRKGPTYGAGPHEGELTLEIWTSSQAKPIYIWCPREIERVWKLLSAE